MLGRPAVAKHATGLRCDVAVVGAGPAGTAAALALRQQQPGLDVLMVDRAPPGRDKTCGDAIGPETLGWLAGLGQHRLLHPEERVASFRVVAPSGDCVLGRSPVPGFVVPRRVFDARLLAAARAAGARFVQAEVATVQQDGGWMRLGLRDGSALLARYVVGADGANSATRRATGTPPSQGRHLAVAVRGYVARPPGADELLLVWDEGHTPLCYAWAFPAADGRMNIGYGRTAHHPAGGRGRLADRCLQLLQSASPDLVRGQVHFSGHRLPLASRRPTVSHGRLLLVGDAASLVNPLSGEGICSAVASGVLAGSAIAACIDDPRSDAAGRRYATMLRDHFGVHLRQTALAYRVLTPGLINASVRAAARDDRLLHALLAFTLGAGVLSAKDVVGLTGRSLAGSRPLRRLWQTSAAEPGHPGPPPRTTPSASPMRCSDTPCDAAVAHPAKPPGRGGEDVGS